MSNAQFRRGAAVRRFDLEQVGGHSEYRSMEESESGDWVRYEDHEAELMRPRAEIDGAWRMLSSLCVERAEGRSLSGAISRLHAQMSLSRKHHQEEVARLDELLRRANARMVPIHVRDELSHDIEVELAKRAALDSGTGA